MLSIYDTAIAHYIRVAICNNNGEYRWKIVTSTGGTTITTAPWSTDTWYCLEVKFENGTANNGYIVYVNGDAIYQSSSPSVDAGRVYVGGWDKAGAPINTYIDDVAVCDVFIGLIVIFVLVSDDFLVTETSLCDKPSLRVIDDFSFSDSLVCSKSLAVWDWIDACEGVLVCKVLPIGENVVAIEVVEKGCFRTRLFLLLGDLAIQLTGN